MKIVSPLIRFPQGMFPELRNRLLVDRDRETFALLLGKSTVTNGLCVIRVVEIVHPSTEDYEAQNLMSLRLKREFVYHQLVRMQERGGVDTLIDVHTHPFCQSEVAFSSVDDKDEIDFKQWLSDTLDNVISYASIVLSQSDYAARVWEMDEGRPVAVQARIGTQIIAEGWPCAETDENEGTAPDDCKLQTGFLARSTLALGLDTMRRIVNDQTIAVVGVGGLGSVIAENLIHLGFPAIQLIDPDRVELTNLNRIVGAYYSDAIQNRLKVDVVGEHLQKINPMARVEGHAIGIEDEAALAVMMRSDWIIVATDNHSSRYRAQKVALQLGVPLISAGVNITVGNGEITDMSGEVIIARSGDGLCLNCLGRINPTYVAADEHKGLLIGEELVRRGYVAGHEVKEPAVKTLNSAVGGLAADMLLNQYTQRQAHVPIWVYENNLQFAMYPDHDSVRLRQKACYFCT
jgi:molybdopterin/thiamine biosynthesis adenylyltransferase